jgi:NADP-dependent 3-hydroxy acid dehydrogenase YdfG
LPAQDLNNRAVVVTGAARGIGEKVARLTVGRGARVGLVGLEPDRLRELAEDLGPAAVWREADVRDGPALRAAIDACAEALGGIDFVVANAGVVAYGTVRQAEEAAFERVLDVNLNGVFRWAKAALNSGLAWPWVRRFAARWVPTIEDEVAALGRNDQLVPGLAVAPEPAALDAERRNAF